MPCDKLNSSNSMTRLCNVDCNVSLAKVKSARMKKTEECSLKLVYLSLETEWVGVFRLVQAIYQNTYLFFETEIFNWVDYLTLYFSLSVCAFTRSATSNSREC